jgi:radical SAM enzyme (TIGR01210 family)
MSGISKVMKRIRKKRRDASSKYFIYSDRISSGKGTVFEIILSSTGCYWAEKGGCTFCGFVYDTGKKQAPSKEFQEIYSKCDAKGPLAIKVYTSGSFFDPKEVPITERKKILDVLASDDRIVDVVVESRPEFIKTPVIKSFSKALAGKNLEVGIGLETANDLVREYCVNKGFTTKEYLRAVKVLKSQGIGVRTYLFVKPPFLTEREALADMKASIDFAAKYSQTIAFNFPFVWRDTLLHELFRKREYRPPWLWTGVEILKYAFKTGKNISVSMIGSGKPRGVHNCGKCDSQLIKKFKESILLQKPQFGKFTCDCKKEWEEIMCMELLA